MGKTLYHHIGSWWWFLVKESPIVNYIISYISDVSLLLYFFNELSVLIVLQAFTYCMCVIALYKMSYSLVEQSQCRYSFLLLFKLKLLLAFRLAYLYIQYIDASLPASSDNADAINQS